MSPRQSRLGALLAALLALPAQAGPEPLPALLADTGLYLPGTQQVSPGNRPFAPQYPLWSDGATKRRWIYLPPGASIDAARP